MKNLLLAIFGGLLLGFSWPHIGFPIFIFFAFIPILFIVHNIDYYARFPFLKVLGFSFITFLVFNVLTTYWIWHSTLLGAFAAFFINTILMSIVLFGFYVVKNIFQNYLAYVFFIVFWLCMEFIHLNWELAWPWVVMGNVFAEYPILVQWYEYTGVLGGSLWVLMINVLIFHLCVVKYSILRLFVTSLCLIFPIICSSFFISDVDQESYIDVVIAQPNVHSFQDSLGLWREEGFTVNDFMSFFTEYINPETDLLLAPETMFESGFFEKNLDVEMSSFHYLQDSFPNLNILLGSTTYKDYGSIRETSTSRKKTYIDEWYDVFNSAVFLSKDRSSFIYHKTRLVPGVEQIPYSSFFNLLGDLTVDLGGVQGSLGVDNDISNFPIFNQRIRPLICYESVFGDIMQSERFDIIAIITNDCWWKNTAGYRQHFDYARLRAIEQRKSVIRSANTGISGVIYSNGEVASHTHWDERVALSVRAPLNSYITFYNRFGDYIGRISSFVSVLFILISFVKYFLKKNTTL